MTRTELVTTLKALRETGVTVPALNSKTTVLQKWYDAYILSLEVPEVSEVSEVEPELYHIVTEQGTLSIWSECESAEGFINSGVLDNAVNVDTWGNGDVRNFNPDTLYCEVPQTLSNFEGIEPEVMAVTDWTVATPLTYDVLSCQSVPVNFTRESVSEGYTHVFGQNNSRKVGIVTVLLLIEFIKLATAVIIPLFAYTLVLISKLAISTTLALQGFKQAARVAKWSNILGYSA